MARSMMKAQIAFGLVNIPVGIHKAVDSHDVSFHLRHAGCGGGVGMPRTCKDCGQVLASADIVKGIDVDGSLVLMSDEDIDAVKEDAGSRAISVEQFLHADDLDPIMLEAPYYLVPDKEALEGYTLLRTVLEESQRVALVRYTMRTTRMAVLRVMGNVLVLQNLTWPDEVRPADFAILAQKVVLKPRAIKVAHQIVESMLGVFDANDWTDTYTQRLTEVITAKALNTEASPVETRCARGCFRPDRCP